MTTCSWPLPSPQGATISSKSRTSKVWWHEIYVLDQPLVNDYDPFNDSLFATSPDTKFSHSSTLSSNVKVPLCHGSTTLGLRRSNDHNLIGFSLVESPKTIDPCTPGYQNGEIFLTTDQRISFLFPINDHDWIVFLLEIYPPFVEVFMGFPSWTYATLVLSHFIWIIWPLILLHDPTVDNTLPPHLLSSKTWKIL